MKRSKDKRKQYNPNVGFIGNSEVKVSNYLFSKKKSRTAYQHAKPITDRLMDIDISEHYSESKKVTRFLKNRDLTFSKKMSDGAYKTFTVPCTTTVVPLQKSLFNEVEVAAQKLIISLRAVIQDIYSSDSIESASFVQSLPESVRTIFVDAIKTSPNYFPQLHSKSMKDYPFFDNVGLDLVLVEDYMTKSKDFPNMIERNNAEELPGLPFRILELNAGSPSGASNNMNVLEGIYQEAPEILNSLGKMMPNDHFEILGKTYKSLGENWTSRKDGVQILLPPGGQNGAAPEIHQLAAYSGLIYADPDQLYQDRDGYIRLRTVAKNNPIVTAIYSRINADSALFDIDKGLLMRDPDTGEPLYLKDNLILDEEKEGQVMLDGKGNPIPLQSAYAIPGIIDAIVTKKIYMGGLNRILDNKIILATLTHYAPKFFAKDIEKAGLTKASKAILPPQTLPPTMKSVEIIKNDPDQWVVKAPELAGGQGVYILKTLSVLERKKVIKMIEKNPQQFAYQQLVKIARIPVAVQRKEEGYKFANLAADIRTWVFFGAGEGELPTMSHNALVRYAPHEKGKMSSIVNTSAGGGYAPFVIIDDVNDNKAISAKELVAPKEPIQLDIETPVFVAAGIVQISRMLKQAGELLSKEVTFSNDIHWLSISMKNQLKEILAFLHPRSIESIYAIIDLLETKVSKKDQKKYRETIERNQLKVVELLTRIEGEKITHEVRDLLDNLRILNTEKIFLNYSEEDSSLDLVLLEDLALLAKGQKERIRKTILEVGQTIESSILTGLPNALLGVKTKNIIKKHLNEFCNKAATRMNASKHLGKFSALLSLDADVTSLKFETLYLGKRDADKDIRIGSQLEMRTGTLLTESDLISDELKSARKDWSKVTSKLTKIAADKKSAYLTTARQKHFNKYPKLAEFQSIINSNNASKDELIKLLDIVPYAKFNIENFASEQGLKVKDVFTKDLKPNRISVLSTEKLTELNLTNREHAGECFAKKKASHGLYSDSDIYVWLRSELDPFTLLYTAGHELIHYQQIKHSMSAEKRALKDGGVSIAKFLNYYGNFLGSNQRTIDKLDSEVATERTPLYGYADKIQDKTDKPVIKGLDKALRISDEAWEQELTKYGSLFGYMMGSTTGIKVKALQEVLPAMENAKNILFAQELGLEINYSATKSAMPTATPAQVAYYQEELEASAKTATVNWETLRLIASHQYYGVQFNRADIEANNLTLTPDVAAVAVGSTYNQTQQ